MRDDKYDTEDDVDYDEPLEIHRSLDTQINADLVYC
jgi:hypothetical protein